MRRSVSMRMAILAALAAGIENRREVRRHESVQTAKELVARERAEQEAIEKARLKRERKAARRTSPTLSGGAL